MGLSLNKKMKKNLSESVNNKKKSLKYSKRLSQNMFGFNYNLFL